MTMRDCIDACDAAHRAATEAAIASIQQGGTDWMLTQLLLDCADITETAADFMLRSSRLHHPVCRVAAEIADACADECEKLAADSIRLKECAQACRRAATACRKQIA